ncbi:hypothetical protein DUT91_25000 [Phyllobacterium salinisoli]|uniref:Uncharacterized protein n=1 Tax=Phyllobacterium salinisoli TaxID=1899321 RepID=A0A368JXY6_9HYPH|nr:hypothetical protein DUT91_25000 [Phyllobacterium salinisoli]
MDVIGERGIKVLLDRKTPVNSFTEAFAHQASGRARGKIIIIFD